MILQHVPKENVRGKRILDVGFNVGYNSLYLASAFGARVTGIENSKANLETAQDLAAFLGVNVEFLIANAETFERQHAFDGALHLGTLYHLPNPVQSMEKTAQCVVPGGWLALETMCYRGGNGEKDCRWIWGLDGDKSNFWSLGEGAIRGILARAGIRNAKLIFEAWPPRYNREHSRAIWLGYKSDT
jgi:SAM-dependent methyltransferase